VNNPFARIRDNLEHDWRSQARPEQLPPSGDWSIWLVLAGRGFGKTRCGAEWVRAQAEAGLASHIGLLGPTSSDVRDVMVATLLEIAPNSNRPLYEPSKRSLTWPNGVQAFALASEEPERIRGFGFSIAWLDEMCAWRNVNETFDLLQFTMRRGRRPRQCITTTPKPIPLLRTLLKRDDVVVTKGSTSDNVKHLAPTFLQTIVSRYQGTRLGRQELDAEILDDAPGAIFRRDLIEAARLPASTAEMDFERVVIGVDPAVSVGEDSDLTGIVACGLDFRGDGHVLEDASGKYLPHEWAQRAIGLYRKWAGGRIVCEVNNGGAMVEATIRSVDLNVSYKSVHASKGKYARAEPVSALYEQGRIHHCGLFAELEDEMCGHSPGMSGKSPDRMDALVWAFTELMVEKQRPVFVFA
jgi:phage terminase large subunit-like protein